MATESANYRYIEIGRRLIALRHALGFEKNQAGFAASLGLTSAAWNNYETGMRRPELDKAMLIRAKTGVTLDWIYEGSTAGLPMDLANRLLETSANRRLR